MLKIINRVSIILLISLIVGVGIFQIVNFAITHSSISSEDWPETFKWLRHISSLGWIGVLAHALPFVLATVIVVSLERVLIGSKK